MFVKLLGLAIAGAAGTLSRYYLSGMVQNSTKHFFPFGTLAVNLIGCLLFGFAWWIMTKRFDMSVEFCTIILVGYMGAFTTFSSFIFDMNQLITDSQWLAVVGYVIISNLVGLIAFVGGLFIARLIF
jgi:fluoride exporter